MHMTFAIHAPGTQVCSNIFIVCGPLDDVSGLTDVDMTRRMTQINCTAPKVGVQTSVLRSGQQEMNSVGRL